MSNWNSFRWCACVRVCVSNCTELLHYLRSIFKDYLAYLLLGVILERNPACFELEQVEDRLNI